MKVDRWTLCLYGVLMLFGTEAHARESLKLAVLNTSPPSVIAGAMLSEIFRQANVPLVLVTMPAARSSVEADAGRVDGEVARVPSYGDAHPMLIRVDPPIDQLSISAYFKKTLRANIARKEDLIPYRVGYVHGLKATYDQVKDLPQFREAQSSKLLVLMLGANRFDAIVNNSASTDYYLFKLGYTDIEQVELSREPVHLFLHQKHRDLVPLIASTIQKMTTSGELTRVRKNAINQLYSSKDVLE